MKLQAEINGEQQEVEINRQDRVVTAKVGGREYTLDVSEPETGVYLIKNGNKISEISVSTGVNAAYTVGVHGRELDINIIDPKRLRGAGKADEDAAGKAEIKTAMPGKVVRILVEVGAQVAKGDGIIVVEAMKMQNELKSPKDGVIAEIRSAEGQTVNAGDVLVVVE